MTYIENSRRVFLKTLTTAAVVTPASLSVFADITGTGKEGIYQGKTAAGLDRNDLPPNCDGPASPLFQALGIQGNQPLSKIDASMVSGKMADSAKNAPSGNTISWGIPFNIPEKIIYLKNDPYRIDIKPLQAKWIVFLHVSDAIKLKRSPDGFFEKPLKGDGMLNEEIAMYNVVYEDDTELPLSIRSRHQINMFQKNWGVNSTESIPHRKPGPDTLNHSMTNYYWGWAQTRVPPYDYGLWLNWLWAWENPNPDKKIKGFRFEPLNKVPLILSAITAGNVSSNPLHWNTRQKALLTLPAGIQLNSMLDNNGNYIGLRLDLGQIASVVPKVNYPENDWQKSYNNKVPAVSENEFILEYTCHPEAMFHDEAQQVIPVSDLLNNDNLANMLRTIKPADQRVKVKVIEKSSGKVVAVKFHAHGEAGEYLPPVGHHRQPNMDWFQDYGTDFVNGGTHICTYTPGDSMIKLPLGKVYIEVSKGFEISPVRKVIEISPETEEIVIEIEKVLKWREKGWVTADTHVHFLSPGVAMLEGAGEGVNIVNLLASQWGELMTNVGDFDGKTTFGEKKFGGDGEYLVRVGTENRQHVMGHISLLGYSGNIIAPMTTGGPDEAALGEPVDILLTEWAMQCKKQGGLVILPHFPNPRLENAATIVSGSADGVEMASGYDPYSGIDSYALADWYRYLNCGYFVPAVGGTDKMSCVVPVGAIRTYARISDNREFNYDEWKESIRRGETFVTVGPLIDFSVEGKPAGTRIDMTSAGGTVNIFWEAASVTVPMSRVDLIVNGEVKESVSVSEWKGSGNWNLKVNISSWIALLVRGHYPDKREIITAHSSPVMIQLNSIPMLVGLDALTILDQIEGAMAYLDTFASRADEKAFKRMKMVLTSAHRTIHNRMHERGFYHDHTPVNDHPEHH